MLHFKLTPYSNDTRHKFAEDLRYSHPNVNGEEVFYKKNEKIEDFLKQSEKNAEAIKALSKGTVSAEASDDLGEHFSSESLIKLLHTEEQKQEAYDLVFNAITLPIKICTEYLDQLINSEELCSKLLNVDKNLSQYYQDSEGRVDPRELIGDRKMVLKIGNDTHIGFNVRTTSNNPLRLKCDVREISHKPTNADTIVYDLKKQQETSYDKDINYKGYIYSKDGLVPLHKAVVINHGGTPSWSTASLELKTGIRRTNDKNTNDQDLYVSASKLTTSTRVHETEEFTDFSDAGDVKKSADVIRLSNLFIDLNI